MKFTFAPEARPLDGYTIKRAIHRGGFGEVYYALSDAGKEVALKLLNNNLEVEIRGVSQCLNLKHQNLVTIFDIREDSDKDHWVVMEYVSGRGLYETLQDYPNGMPVEEVLKWLSGMTAGLSFLHDRGIVHRDLKPANVFQDQGIVKIGDVGLSKYISESRRSAQTQSVGTVYYMAPEVARGRYGREVDVYALGIMLYEMLTGTVPFDGQTTAEILMKHLTAEPDVSVLPKDMQQVVAGALEKDPDKRINSVEALEHAFRSAVAGADVSAPVQKAQAFVGKAAPQPQPSPEPVHARVPRDADTIIDIETSPTSEPVMGVAAIAAFWNALPSPLQWILGGATALLIIESGMLRPVAVGGMIGGVAYLGYQIVQVFVGAASPAPARRAGRGLAGRRSQPPPHRPAPAMAASAPRQQGKADPLQGRPVAANPPAARIYTPATLRKITKRQRATDVTTSISVSLAAAALVTLAVFLTTNLLKDISQAVYFAAITMVAAWGLILPSKIWEGRPGDGVMRRFTLASVGLGVGFVAAMLPQYLLIDQDALFHGSTVGHQVYVGRLTMSDGSGIPTVACFMTFFAALFGIRRWWWQVDSFRKSRFRVSSALMTLVVGVVISGMLQEFSFPDALGATWALAISAVVQLSSGWTPAENRLLEPTNIPAPAKPIKTPEPVPQLAGREAASVN